MSDKELLHLSKILEENLQKFEKNNNLQNLLIANSILYTLLKTNQSVSYQLEFMSHKYNIPKDNITLFDKVFNIIKVNIKKIK